MGQIGRWIDEKCRREPEVMRHVLNRKFGNLGNFVDLDGKCGCLAGSYALARTHDERAARNLCAPRTELDQIGMAVYHLSERNRTRERKERQAIVVRLVKQRIRKALGIAPQREAAFSLAQGAET